MIFNYYDVYINVISIDIDGVHIPNINILDAALSAVLYHFVCFYDNKKYLFLNFCDSCNI